MKRKHPHDSDSEETPAPGFSITRRRPIIVALWLLLFGLVFVVISNVLPIGSNSSPIRARRAKQQLTAAESMEKQELWRAAADAYEAIADDALLKGEIRSQAAQHLASLYAHNLNDRDQAKKALEKAYFFAQDDHRRAELKSELDALRGPDRSVPGSATANIKVAKIGDQEVKLDEILYAWKRLSGGQEQPTNETLEKFTIEYMNNVLLAEEAKRRGKQSERNFILDSGFYERQLLAQSLLRSLVPDVDEPSVRNYYITHMGKYQAPPSVAAEGILVNTLPEAETVGRRLSAGEDFAKVASEVSLQKDALPEGRKLGRITEGKDAIPYVGTIPGLSMSLVKLSDGFTTGPIQSALGFHWIRVSDKIGPAPKTFEAVKEQAEMDLRRDQFEGAQKDLLNRLKQSIPIEIYEGVIGDALSRAAAQQLPPPAKPSVSLPGAPGAAKAPVPQARRRPTPTKAPSP